MGSFKEVQPVHPIDLRSDTVTRPSKGMRDAMMNADVGDDVFHEDPTVNRLEAMMAELTGQDAAIFACSGTQSNLIGIMAHCERGDEYIVGQTAHTYRWEGGGAAVLGSIQPQPLDFEQDGTLCLNKVSQFIKPVDPHYARSRLLCLENTAQGKVLPLDYLQTIKPFCRLNQLACHLDGARVFNASQKLNIPVDQISTCFDSVSICFSKGLGAPVGSILCGSHEVIDKARRWRKVLGGGMRQAGFLAAAAIYAIEHNVKRLVDDHENAATLAVGLNTIYEISVIEPPQTNIVFLKINQQHAALQAYLQEQGIVIAKQPNKEGVTRLVTHLDITAHDIARVIEHVKLFFSRSHR